MGSKIGFKLLFGPLILDLAKVGVVSGMIKINLKGNCNLQFVTVISS